MTPHRPLSRRLLIGGAAAVAPFGGIGRAARAAASDQAFPPLRLGWRAVSPSGVIVLTADRDGLFSGNNLRVALRARSDNDPSLARQMRDGTIDACVAPVPLFLPPLLGGLDARFTAGLSGGGLRLLTDRHTRLHHIEDLKHRTIGVADPEGAARLFFAVMLRRKGIDPVHDVRWVAVAPGAMADAIHAKQVDAVALTDPDAFALRERLRLVEVATNVSGSYRDRTYSALLVSGAVLRDRRAEAAALTRALHAASVLVATHPAAAAAVAAPIAPDLSDRDWQRMLRGEAADQHPTGGALVEDVAAYADELRLLGELPFTTHSGAFARGICDVDLIS